MFLSLLAISFLNPLLLWGSALAAIPLIIHILNRRRFRRVRWAAMEFLLRAFKKNRRRARFEQLLLLLLRMLLVALAAFLLSRPRASSDDVFGLTKRWAEVFAYSHAQGLLPSGDLNWFPGHSFNQPLLFSTALWQVHDDFGSSMKAADWAASLSGSGTSGFSGGSGFGGGGGLGGGGGGSW